MLTMYYITIPLVLTITTCGEIVPCRMQDRPEHRIIANIAVKRNNLANFIFNNEMYEVMVDTGSAVLWLINKKYTLYRYIHPESVTKETPPVFDMNCHLITHAVKTVVPPLFTRNPVKYEPDPETEISFESCPTDHFGLYGDDLWLEVIYSLYNEMATIGRSNFILPIGGVWKIYTKSIYSNLFSDGILGLSPSFQKNPKESKYEFFSQKELNQQNLLFNIKPYLHLPMFALYANLTFCHLSVGEPMARIERSKLFTVWTCNNRVSGQIWSFQPIRFEMSFCNGSQQKKTMNSIAPVNIDSGTSHVLFPIRMYYEWYENLGISDVDNLPKECSYWEALNPVLDISIDGQNHIRLGFENLIHHHDVLPDQCECIVKVDRNENIVELGDRLFKTYYVEFHFKNERNLTMKFLPMFNV